MGLVLTLLGLWLLFWLWVFVFSTAHCPVCGQDLYYDAGPMHLRRARCTCGWTDDD